MKLTEIIKYPLTSLLDLVYPPICPVTNYILKDNESIISNSILISNNLDKFEQFKMSCFIEFFCFTKLQMFF